MEENQVTEQAVQTETESVADDWEDEPLYPDESASGESVTDENPDGDVDFEKLFADGETGTSDADAGTPDADASGKADAPSEESGGKSGKDTPDASPDETKSDAETPEPDYKTLYEGLQERQNADKFRAVYHEQLSLTGNEAIARMVAMNECGGKAYPLEDASAVADGNAANASGTPADGRGANAGKSDADFRAALTEIQSLYPDAKEMPQSVMRDYMGGKPLKEAYAAYRAGEDAKTIASLRAEVDALKKAASNRAAAPVKGTNGDKSVTVNAFLEAFDEEF